MGTQGCRVITLNSLQKFREFLEGSNLISKLQAKHDLLKRTLGEGIVTTSCSALIAPTVSANCHLSMSNPLFFLCVSFIQLKQGRI